MIVTKQNRVRNLFAPLFFLGGIFFVSIVSLGVFGSAPHIVHAQRYGNAIATTRHISGGTPRTGDVVSFDPHAGTFYLAYTVSDANVAGVVVKNPVLLLSDKNGGTPVVTSGQTAVNVTTANGSISVGDYLTSSTIRGVAERASSTAPYIIGTALSAFPPMASTTVAGGSTTGQVQVLLAIGSNPVLSSGNSPSGAPFSAPITAATATAVGADIIFRMVKYLLAALVTAGTIYVAFRTSRAAMNSSIISIGRNPLAKQSIRSMLLADTAIIILISVVGLAMALALVLVPV